MIRDLIINLSDLPESKTIGCFFNHCCILEWKVRSSFSTTGFQKNNTVLYHVSPVGHKLYKVLALVTSLSPTDISLLNMILLYNLCPVIKCVTCVCPHCSAVETHSKRWQVLTHMFSSQQSRGRNTQTQIISRMRRHSIMWR